MSFLDAKSYPPSQQQENSTLETRNRYTQAALEVSVKELEEEIQLFDEREGEFDSEILPLDREVAEIEIKVKQLQHIAEFARKFQELQQEIQDDRDLINALYISIFSVAD